MAGGASAVQVVPWDTVNLLRPFFTPGLRPIAETVLTAPAASVTFSSIPGNYRALVLLAQARTDAVLESDNVNWQANGDAGGNYDYAYGRFVGDNTQSSGAFIGSWFGHASRAEAVNSRANNFAPGMCWWLGYALADREKQSFTPATPAFGDVSAVSDMDIRVLSGRWRSTAAITSLTFIPQVGPNFVAGSRFALYGVL